MSFDIDAHEWRKCATCGALFTEEYAMEVWNGRAQTRNDQLARLSEEKRARIGHQLAPIPLCPRQGCPGGAKGSVQHVISLGDKDRRNIMRKARRQEIFRWLKRKLALAS